MHPVVLAHGYLGFNNLGPAEYFHGVEAILRDLGATTIVKTVVDPKGSLVDRARELAGQIDRQAGANKVHIIAHSMGGLDARYVCGRNLCKKAQIETLSTLGTPHRGTLVADLASLNPGAIAQLGLAGVIQTAAKDALFHLPQILASGLPELNFGLVRIEELLAAAVGADWTAVRGYLKGLITLSDFALGELTTDSCARTFPADQSDIGGLRCFSYAAVAEPGHLSPLFLLTYPILKSHNGPNDGLVPLSSATLATHKTNVVTDHTGLIGWRREDINALYRAVVSNAEGGV